MIYRHFLEKHDSEDLQDFARISGDGLLPGDDRHQHVHAHRDPDLRLDRVGRRAVESLDPQVLLDPLEEQLHLPAAFVELRDGEGWEDEVVGAVRWSRRCASRWFCR